MVNGTGNSVCWEKTMLSDSRTFVREDSGMELPSLVFGFGDFRKNVVGHLSEGRGEGAL